MSRDLPTRPNLDHLRKQAKQRLRELQRSAPGSRLADAQQAIAREYGLGSWPKLKAYVESLAPSADAELATEARPRRGGDLGGGGVGADTVDGGAPDGAFQRFTPKARQALFFSRFEAGSCGSVSIEPQHILLGLIRAGQGLQGRIFERLHYSLEEARLDVFATTVTREPLGTFVVIPFSAGTRRVLRSAIDEADRLAHRSIGLAHWVAGLLSQEESLAAELLIGRGLSLQIVRDGFEHLLNEEPS